MGLDIYFNKSTKTAFQTAKNENDFSNIKITQLGYFQRNPLLPFFGYEDNLIFGH